MQINKEVHIYLAALFIKTDFYRLILKFDRLVEKTEGHNFLQI